MNAQNDNTTPSSTTTWWRWWTPPRSGMQRIIPPWEYRHLRGWAGVRITAGIVLAGLGAVTLIGGSFSPKAAGWAMLFLAAGRRRAPCSPPRGGGCWFGAGEATARRPPAGGPGPRDGQSGARKTVPRITWPAA